MNDSGKPEQFIDLYTRHQRRVYLYILTLIPNRADAEDILQETNLVLWQKFDEFRSGTNFFSWACRIAHYEVLKLRRRKSRGMRFFTDEFLEDIAVEITADADMLETQYQALADCLEKLSDKDRDLIQRRYLPESSVKLVADQVGRSVDAVYKALNRIREALFECVDRTLSAEERR